MELFPTTYRQASYFRAAANGWSKVNVGVAAKLGPGVDKGALVDALNELVIRHEALRTTLVATDECVMQSVAASGDLGLEKGEIRSLSAAGESPSGLTIEAAIAEPFNVDGGRLARARMIRLESGQEVLMIAVNHAVCDGWSAGLLYRDLLELYQARVVGRAAQLPEIEVQLADYAVWERGRRSVARETYWNEQLNGRQRRLCSGRLIGADFRPAELECIALPLMSRALVSRMDALAAAHRTTRPRVLAAAALTSISGYMPERTVIGVVTSNRTPKELRNVVGEFEDTLPVPIDVTARLRFVDLLHALDAAVADAYDHQLPTGLLEPALRSSPGGRTGPLYDLVINYLPRVIREQRGIGVDVGDAQPLQSMELEHQGWRDRVDRWWSIAALLGYQFRELADGGVAGWLSVNRNGFVIERAAQLAEHVANVVERVCGDPTLSVASLAQ